VTLLRFAVVWPVRLNICNLQVSGTLSYRGAILFCGFCGNTKSLQAIIGILPENIPRPLYSTLQYVTYRASSSMVPTVVTTITMRAPVVTRSHLLLHSDLMEPLSHFPPPFLLLSRGLVVHYTPAEIQRGIIYSIYSSPHPSFFHYIFPFLPFLLPS